MNICPICDKYLDIHWKANSISQGYEVCPKSHYSISVDESNSLIVEYISHNSYMVVNYFLKNSCTIQKMPDKLDNLIGEVVTTSGFIRYTENFEIIIQNHLLLA